MNDRRTGRGVAVVRPDGAAAAAFEEFVRARGCSDERPYSASELGRVDQAVRAGEIQHVVLPDVGALLTGMWEGSVDFAAWRQRGVQLDFAGVPASDVAWLEQCAQCWNEWNGRRRRIKTIAGACLSALAVASAFLLQRAIQ